MKQQLKSELNMNWNEAFDVVKDEKDCKILRLSYVANIVVLSWCDVDTDITSAYLLVIRYFLYP